jgi:hypothetical protein
LKNYKSIYSKPSRRTIFGDGTVVGGHERKSWHRRKSLLGTSSPKCCGILHPVETRWERRKLKARTEYIKNISARWRAFICTYMSTYTGWENGIPRNWVKLPSLLPWNVAYGSATGGELALATTNPQDRNGSIKVSSIEKLIMERVPVVCLIRRAAAVKGDLGIRYGGSMLTSPVRHAPNHERRIQFDNMELGSMKGRLAVRTAEVLFPQNPRQ